METVRVTSSGMCGHMQGASDRPDAKAGGTLASHAADLGTLVRALPRPPVVVAHSFGGLVLQRCGFMRCLVSGP